MIEFLCPHCRSPLTVPDADAGQKQHCPTCGGKLRVPADVIPPAAGVRIEFLCPRCEAALFAPASSAGAKQNCSRCGAKVRVPLPNAPGEPFAATSAAPPVPQVAETRRESLPPDRQSEFARLAAAIPADSPVTVTRQRLSLLPLVIPLISVALLSMVGAWLLRRSLPKLVVMLAGVRLTDDVLGPFRIDNRHLGRPRSAAAGAYPTCFQAGTIAGRQPDSGSGIQGRFRRHRHRDPSYRQIELSTALIRIRDQRLARSYLEKEKRPVQVGPRRRIITVGPRICRCA